MAKSILLFLLIPVFAVAGGGDDEHALSVSGGIASPSFASAVFQNPAGLVFNSRLKGTVHGAFSNGTELRAGVLGGGSGNFGGGAGLSRDFESETNGAFYGLAVGASGFSLGAAGFTAIDGGGSSFNAGALFGSGDRLRVGMTAVGVDDGVDEWGAGVALSTGGVTGVVLDAAVDSSFDDFSFQPGLIVGNPTAALTLSYGIGTREGRRGRGAVSSTQLSDGFSLGGSLKAGPSARLEAYYNQLANAYVAASFDF